MKYPRIEVVKSRSFSSRAAVQNYMKTGICYAESYKVQVMRPNRPMQSRSNLSEYESRIYSVRAKAALKKEGYDKAVINGRLTIL